MICTVKQPGITGIRGSGLVFRGKGPTQVQSRSLVLPSMITREKRSQRSLVSVQKPLHLSAVIGGVGNLSVRREKSEFVTCGAYEADRSEVEGAGASSPKVPSEAAKKVKIGIYFATWWALNVVFNIYNKKVLNAYPYPWLTSTLSLACGSLMMLISWATRIAEAPKTDLEFWKTLFPVAVAHTIGHVAATVSMSKVAVSFTHIIKSGEPAFSVLVSRFILGETFPVPVYLSLIPIIGGCALAAVTELNFNMIGFMGAYNNHPVLTLHLKDPILEQNSDTLFTPTPTMASTNSTNSTDPLPSPDDIAAKALTKRFDALITVRTKAIKGKGAWYWTHLEPILVRNPDSGAPKSVKLKCSLCDSVFSASNPSRTASEHLKRGTCPNFSTGLRPGSVPSPLPISVVNTGSNHSNNSRKRASPASPAPYQNHALAMVESSKFGPFGGEIGYTQVHGNSVNQHHHHNQHQHHHHQQQHLVLSGGKEDLCALAMFEDSVKKLKSPKTSPGPALSKEQVNSALELLSEWLYETCGSVSLATIEHRKFQAFLSQVGLPATNTLRREISGPRLDAKFSEAKAESEAKIRDAMFFQVASDGWKNRNWYSLCCGGENLVKFVVNLPNGTSVFQKALFTGGVVSSSYAEEVLWETVTGASGSVVQRCVGIVADKFKAKALRNLEAQNHWMVNTSCQLQGFISLIKDFNNELPLFRVVIENCLKVANFIDNESQVRNSFLKYRMQEMEYSGLIRVPSPKCDPLKNFAALFPMLEDIWSCARVIQMVVMEDTFKVNCMEDPLAREVAAMVQNEGFWNELEAVYSIVKVIRGMIQDIEAERPLIGRCLPLWEELRTKVKEWCSKYNIAEGPVEKIVEKRFRKNYHPAWAAAFILDPLYLIKDTSGKYLPPFKCLTREQEKDVDKLLTRLASREEAHVVLMELMKWRSEGLDPLYAQAVQIKQRDPATGRMKVANPLGSRLVWETCLSEFKSLGKIAVRLIFLHATSCGFKSNWSFMRKISTNKQSRVALERAQKMVYVAAHAKLERRDFSSEEEKDAELFAMSGSSEEGMLADVYADASLV